MGSRSTRAGTVFATWEQDFVSTSLRAPDVVFSDVDLEDVLRPALEKADRYAACQDRADGDITMEVIHADDDGGDDADDDVWEDEDEALQSQIPSPASSPSPSPDSSTAASPSPSRPTSPVPPPVSYPTGPGVEQRRRKDACRERKKRRRARDAPKTPYDRKPDPRYSQKHRELTPEAVAFDAADLPTSSGGSWGGGCSQPQRQRGGRTGRRRPRRRLFTLPQLYAEGCRLVRWNGRYDPCPIRSCTPLTYLLSDPKLILDARGRIVAILIGRPEDPDWDAVVEEAVREMARARRRCIRLGLFRANPLHRRGTFVNPSTGVSLGGGQKVGFFIDPHFHSNAALASGKHLQLARAIQNYPTTETQS